MKFFHKLAIPPPLKDALFTLATQVKLAGGTAYVVGGCVRDHLLGLPLGEIDVEVFGLCPNSLESLLHKHFRVDFVGKAFGVFKLKDVPLDVSLPRLESKSGLGHQAFAIESRPHLSIKEASSRRDFTCNAILLDPLTGQIQDPFNGQQDIHDKILRHVSPQFSEDPLRVLRAMQFTSRFQFTIHPSTLALCQKITPEGIASERFFPEWQKLILQGTKPSLGLNFLKDSRWLQYYPELAALVNCPQDPAFHPEGDVWTHTLQALDAFANTRLSKPAEDLTVGLAVLCHDLGKPSTTQIEPSGAIRSPGHDVAGLPFAQTFLERISASKSLIEDILPLVLTHMRPAELFKVNASDSAIRRLANTAKRLDRLIRVVDADGAGRHPYPPKPEITAWLSQRAHALSIQDSTPKPILMGRHLIEYGLKPSPLFSKILKHCFEAQLDGVFTDEASALTYLRSYLSKT